MTVNVPLLRKGVEWVEEQDALPVTRTRWNQSTYVLPWRGWLAWQVRTSEFREMLKQPETFPLLHCGTACCFAGYIAQECEPGFTELDIQEQNMRARSVAIRHLGIGETQADALFNSENDAPRIRRVAEDIAGEPL